MSDIDRHADDARIFLFGHRGALACRAARHKQLHATIDLAIDKRTHARFINITMMATLLGSAVSDQLTNGQVVSGVGGQSDFVNMAHQLPDGRSRVVASTTTSWVFR